MNETMTQQRPAGLDTPSAPVPHSFAQPAATVPELRISWAGAAAAAVSWVATIAIVEAVAPPADPNAVLSAFEALLTLAFTTAILVAAVGLAMRQRLGVMATIVGGGVFVAGSVSCWMGGHVGSWITVQAVLGVTMMLVGGGVLRRS